MNSIEITNKEVFAATIRKLADDNDLNLIEALTSYCEDHDFMMEDVLPLLDNNIKEEIRNIAIDKRYVFGFTQSKKLF